jgi:N-hydroxyarylamine O-acetyltransferase
MTATVVDPLVDAYLELLGVPRESPTPEHLCRLHRAHTERLGHDTVWISRGRIPDLDHRAMATALLGGEGGGCVQLSAGLSWLLESLGYEVTLHAARIQRAFAATADGAFGGHIVMTVRFDDEVWYADPGLGNGLRDPVPLRVGEFTQGPFRYRLELAEEIGGWRFVHDPRVMAARAVEVLLAPRPLDWFAPIYRTDTTDPESIHVRYISANRRGEDAVSVLLGRRVVRLGVEGRTVRVLHDEHDWEQALRNDFRLALPGLTASELAELWAKVD